MSVPEASIRPQPPTLLRAFEDGLLITTFDPARRKAFRRLNLAWLTRYVTVEPIDERVLGDPEKEILAPGGEILFALLDEQVVGTVALRREGDSFEITKMAVDERCQGRGFGKRLLQEACALAKLRGAREVFVYSKRSLRAAVSMYFKYGFAELPQENDPRYSRCDIRMQRVL